MKKVFFILLFSSLFTFTSCNKEPDSPTKLNGFVFGTTYTIIYYDVATNFEEDINQLFDEVNQSTSTYIYSSDISRINKTTSLMDSRDNNIVYSFLISS